MCCSWTPLVAANCGRDDIVQRLLDSGASVDFACSDGATALHVACGLGHADELNQRDDEDADFHEVATLLLDNGANINAATADGSTPLMLASEYGRAELVEMLLAAGADVNFTTAAGKGFTALMLAAARGRDDIVQMLLDEGGDVDAIDYQGGTALLAACGRITMADEEDEDPDYEAVIELLLDAGATLDCHTEDGSTPLIFACGQGRAAVVRRLLEEGVDVNVSAAGRDGRTAVTTLEAYVLQQL